MSYNSNTDLYEVDDDFHASLKYETVSDAKSKNQLRYYTGNGYRLIVDGVKYEFSINGLKLLRDEQGHGYGTGWASYYNNDEITAISAQTSAVARMEDSSTVLPGSVDNDWTMITLSSACSGHLSVEDPTAVDDHVLVYDDTNTPAAIRVDVEWADGVEPVGGSTVSFRLHKDTQGGDSVDFYEDAATGSDFSETCGGGTTFSGTVTQSKTTTIMDQAVSGDVVDSLSQKLYSFQAGVSTTKTEYGVPVDAQKMMTLHVDEVPEGFAYYVTQSTGDIMSLRTCTFTIHLTKQTPFTFALADQNEDMLTIDPAQGTFVLTNGFDEV